MATKKKLQPAVRYLRYELTNSGTPGTETSHYIDLARDLSRVNRRLYRQGRDYHVKRITIVSSNTPNSTAGAENRVSFSTAPNSWVTQMAWKRGFEMMKLMNREASKGMSGDISGKYADYKVYLTDDMRTGTVLAPKDNGGNIAVNGEWTYTKLVTPDGTTGADEFELHLLGNHNGGAGSRVSVGLVKSYGESRLTVDQDSPNATPVSTGDPLANLFDDGTVDDEILANLKADNDNSPYSANNYPGDDGNMPKPLVVQDTTIVDGRAVVGGFMARCGLIEIEAKSPIGSDVYSVLVELAPGSYRGVAADVIA
jgi:hypothetical protein